MRKIKNNSKEEIVINHIFNDYIDFDNYILSNKETCNGVSVEFLKEHYNGNIIKWYQDNFTNSCCFNCFNCENCVNCTECQDCKYCAECFGAKNGFNHYEDNDSNYLNINKNNYDIFRN